MLNTIRMSFKIDATYAINSFIYSLKRLPIFKDLFPGDGLYKSKKAKSIIRILGFILSSARLLFFKLLYFATIYFLATYTNPKNITETTLHIYFFFTVIGMFINNKILSTSTKKYFSIILFNMDAKQFMKSSLFQDIIINFITHTIGLYLLVKTPIVILFTIFGILVRLIGERINLYHYNKYKISIPYNYPIYWTVVILGLALCLLPIINITISSKIVMILNIILLPIAYLSYRSLMKVDNYKLIYKKLNTK